MKYMMPQHDEPGDFVVATGGNYSVGDFLEPAQQELTLARAGHTVAPRGGAYG